MHASNSSNCKVTKSPPNNKSHLVDIEQRNEDESVSPVPTMATKPSATWTLKFKTKIVGCYATKLGRFVLQASCNLGVMLCCGWVLPFWCPFIGLE